MSRSRNAGMRHVPQCLFLISYLLLAGAGWLHGSEKIRMDVKINGKPAHLDFDTGASGLILFPKGAARLGLKVTPQELTFNSQKMNGGVTDECTITIQSSTVKQQLHVVDFPGYLDAGSDGVIGWEILRNNILAIDAEKHSVVALENAPASDPKWTKFSIKQESALLRLEFSQTRGSEDAPLFLLIDTGSLSGVAFREDLWEKWKADHPDAPMTLNAFFMVGAGVVAREEAWTKEITFGDLRLTNVPVREANKIEETEAPGFQATLGLAALKCLDVIVDGGKGVAYIKLKTTPPPPYSHNRAGAVFIPAGPDNDDLAAHVIVGSPAATAGIRDGDVLLKIGELDVTKWRTDHTVLPLSRFLEKPAGTKLELTLKRGEETYKATVTLRQILGA